MKAELKATRYLPGKVANLLWQEELGIQVTDDELWQALDAAIATLRRIPANELAANEAAFLTTWAPRVDDYWGN